MNNNRIGLHILFALLGLGASLLFFGLGGQLILEVYRYDHYSHNNELIGGTVFSVISVVCLIFSIALIRRLSWARIAFQVLLLLGGIVWLIFMAFLAQGTGAWPIVAGMAAAGIMIVVFGVLFLENAHFIEDLEQNQNEGKDYLEILDQ